MKKNKQFQCVIAAVALFGTLLMVNSVEAAGYGKVIGKFVFKGKIPEKAILVKKGDPAAKDAKVCAAHGVKSNALVIDKKTRGIKNILVYIKTMESDEIHPKLAKSAKKVVDFDQVGCSFTPHILIVRTDQKVRVLSGDNCSHNFHSLPIRQRASNFVVQPMDRKGKLVEMKTSESLPTSIKCDIHPWMKAYWLVLNHPYSTKTKEDGSFEIDLVPAGKQKFRVWHEKKGYVNAGKRTGFTARVKDGKTFDLGTIELTVDDLK
ncbi:hypothetical protein MNBD_PLANCTO02-2174 [hydrothermal vent metagenome]|uniref:Methylamine utilization protein n=1 Tax=hydrothermal vent metagenome TaxID=652676 RepID=A0A3B1DB44_9ZZZZ